MTLTLAELIRRDREIIVAGFVARVGDGELSPPGLSRSMIADHIPSFLEEVAAELAGGGKLEASQDADDQSPVARQHGQQRWKVGYDLEALVREYGILRQVIVEAARAARIPLTLDDFDVFAKCLNVGVAEAATAYARYRDQELERERAKIQFLTQAGQLLTSSLDYASTLGRLTRLIVPQLADWCAVYIDGAPNEAMPIAHVDPSKVGALRQLFVRFKLPDDSPHSHAEVVRTGESQLVEHMPDGFMTAIASSPEHAELLREINACSWLIVPLRVQKTTFGAITLGCSESGRHYGKADLELAEELARRAAIAIDNAHLYARSQQERARVDAATRAKDEFVAMVSHELRTPLNVIVGWLRLMRGGGLTSEKRTSALEVMERNARSKTPASRWRASASRSTPRSTAKAR